MFLTPRELGQFQDKLWQDLFAFLPELTLCFTIVLLLLLRLSRTSYRMHLGPLVLLLTALALVFDGIVWSGILPLAPSRWFGGLLAHDRMTDYVRFFLLLFTIFVVLLTLLTRIPDREDSADFYCLLLGATVGMCLMASANHLLMVYLGVEMASLPSYALAGFLKGRRQSSEAALKYVVYGGGASGVMLYGISLLSGKFGTGYLPEIAAGFARTLSAGSAGTPAGFDTVLLLGTLFVLVGIAFKLAAVPFHFWCPDVFEGAAAEVAAFLSVASKGAALALLARFTMSLAGMVRDFTLPLDYRGWLSVVYYLAPSLALAAIVTATFGNLAAYLQTNLKRLLAYSTIAHAGYMLMGLATLTREGTAAVLFYLLPYLFMNLGAFAVVAFLRNQTGTEDLSGYRGMIQRAPALTVLMAIFLLSLLGMPPLAGFVAKVMIFLSLFRAGQMYGEINQTGLSYAMYAMLAIAGLNTVVSAVYYLKVLKVMILDRPLEEVEERRPALLAVPAVANFYTGLLALAVVAGGLFWGPLATATGDRSGVASHFRVPPPEHPPPVPMPVGAGPIGG